MIVREGATALEGLIELTRNNDGWSLDKTLVCICESVVCVLVIRIQCQLFSAVIHMLRRAMSSGQHSYVRTCFFVAFKIRCTDGHCLLCLPLKVYTPTIMYVALCPHYVHVFVYIHTVHVCAFTEWNQMLLKASQWPQGAQVRCKSIRTYLYVYIYTHFHSTKYCYIQV